MEINDMKKEHNYQINFSYETENIDEPDSDNNVFYRTLNCWLSIDDIRMCKTEDDWKRLLEEKLSHTTSEDEIQLDEVVNLEFDDCNPIDRRTKSYRRLV